MINRYQYKDSTWVDIINPTTEELTKIRNEFSLHPHVIDELTSPSVKSRVELHKEYLYMILHFPAFKHSHVNEPKQEVDFVIGHNFLITARYENIDAIDKFAKVVEVNSILDRGFGEDHSGVLFFGVLREIYQSLFDELEYIESWIGKIEEGIFHGQEKEMVFSLSQVSRTLLNFKKATDFHREVLESLDLYGKKIFDDRFSYHARRILDEYVKVQNLVANNMAGVSELRETNNSLVSTKQNEIMKTLTITAFIALPLTLIATIFSMNSKHNPIVGHPLDFWIILVFMLMTTTAFFAYFKYKRWF